MGPGDARLRGSGLSVWAMVLYYRGADGDVAEVARAYETTPEAIEAGLAYYQLHKAAIDARIEDHLAFVA